MPNKEPAMCSASDEVNFFRYSSLKGQLKLEQLGLKSSGGALRPRLAQEFGLKPKDSLDLYIEKCVEIMNKAYEAKHGPQEEPQFKV